MLCPHCTKAFKNMGHPAFWLIMRSCQAFEEHENISYCTYTYPYTECVRFLELNGYLVTTEIEKNRVGYKVNTRQMWHDESGYYCWCHLHKRIESNDG